MRIKRNPFILLLIRNLITHLKVFSREQLDTHDGKDEPEDDADHQHVEDAGNGLDEGVHNDLKVKSYCSGVQYALKLLIRRGGLILLY